MEFTVKPAEKRMKGIFDKLGMIAKPREIRSVVKTCMIVTQGMIADQFKQGGNVISANRPLDYTITKWTNAGDLTLKTFKDDRGKFGRILGEIWYGGEHNINQLLIDNHHAVRYHGQSKDDIAEEHLKNRELVKL